MKDIFFVRHGQTQQNTRHVHQQYDVPLSDEGRNQGRQVAEYVSTLTPDTILTSPFTRARETAEFIGSATDLPITIVTAVHEILRPTFLYGKKHASFASLKYLLKLFLHRKENTWDNDGGENVFDLRNRVHDTKDLIVEEEGERIVVVSHSVFMDMFVHMICQQEPMSFMAFVRMLMFIKKLPNTVVVHIQYNPEAPTGVCQWQLVAVVSPSEFGG